MRRSSAQRRVLEVPEVELDALGPRQRRAAVDLRPARQPGAHLEPAALAVGVGVDLDLDRRPRPDERHLAPQHVDEVRQLVDRGPPQQRADARDARVALVDRHPGAHVLGAGDHRAQLVDLERVAVAADAALAVDRVPGRLEPHGQRGERDDRRASRRAARPRPRRRAPACAASAGTRSAGALRRVPARRRAVAQPVVQPGGERGGRQHVVAGDEQRAGLHVRAGQRGGDAARPARRPRAGRRARGRAARAWRARPARAAAACRSAAAGARRSSARTAASTRAGRAARP